MNNNDEDIDPFSFRKKSFKSKKVNTCDDSVSSDDSDESDNSDSSLDAGCSNTRKRRRRRYSDSSSSDSDSCVCEEVTEVATTSKNGEGRAVAFLDGIDSDDSDDDIDNDNDLSKLNSTGGTNSMMALKKAHMAKEALKKAQQTKIIEEIHVETDDDYDNDLNDDVLVVEEIDNMSKTTSHQMRIELRTSTTKDSFKLNASDKFEKLIEAYRSRHKLAPTTEMKLKFDGQLVSSLQTPTSLDMDDGDLMDVILKDRVGNIVALPSKTTSTGGNEAAVVVIKTYMPNQQSDLFQIRCTDPFSKLYSALCKKRDLQQSQIELEYKGNIILTSSTPSSVGMKGGSTAVPPFAMQVRILGGISNISSSSCSGKKILLKLRINGKDADMKEMHMGETDNFSSLLKQFCSKNSLSEDTVCFTLDGEILNPIATPKGEDLEGGEILDVLVKETKQQITVDGSSLPFSNLKDTSDQSFENSFIDIFTVRNLGKTRPKKFNVNKCDVVKKLKQEYMKVYKSKGCKSVKFYFRDQLLQENASLGSLMVQNEDKIFAMENGRKYKPQS